MSELAIGIFSGLLTAFMQSCSYLGGRRFLARCGNSTQLTVCSLLITGAVTWLLAPFFLLTEHLGSWRLWLWVLITDLGLVIGHWGFFSAQKYIESSRIASLMGLKIVLIALFSIIIFGSRFTAVQYCAMAGTVLAGMLMNWSKGRMNWNGMGYMLMALCGYCSSDLGVQKVVESMGSANVLASGLSGFILNYSVTGIGAICLLKSCRIDRRMLLGAVPQAMCWVVSMIGLYVCFGTLGAAFGNVLQASRGVISLGLGIVLSFWAIQGLEQKQSWTEWLRKSAAALIMFGSIVLYVLSTKG